MQMAADAIAGNADVWGGYYKVGRRCKHGRVWVGLNLPRHVACREGG